MRLEHVGANVTLAQAGVSLGGQAVLRDISLSLGPADVLGVAGPNGSGKTTLLRLLATLVRPDEGSGRVLGAALGTQEVYAIRPEIGLIGHIPSLIAELSLRENLEHALRLLGQDPSRVDQALRVVGLEGAADRNVTQSSHGMLRRTETARLLLTRPRLLLLDEPFTGLDTSAQELIDKLVERAVSAGGSVVMVSHDEAHLASRTDRIMGINAGRLEPVA
jgi:heme ABC exporter ATP-binding subunit CcmA